MNPESFSEHRRLLLGALGVAGVAALARPAAAGPLSPPPGPIRPTPGPEPRIPISPETTPGDETAHFVISQSGSYYMQRNLSATEVTRSAIKIAADHVTIDLNGFAISGNSTGVAGALTFLTEPVEGLVIRNGTIRSWGEASQVSVDNPHASGEVHRVVEACTVLWRGRRPIAHSHSIRIRVQDS